MTLIVWTHLAYLAINGALTCQVKSGPATAATPVFACCGGGIFLIIYAVIAGIALVFIGSFLSGVLVWLLTNKKRLGLWLMLAPATIVIGVSAWNIDLTRGLLDGGFLAFVLAAGLGLGSIASFISGLVCLFTTKRQLGLWLILIPLTIFTVFVAWLRMSGNWV